MHSMEINGWTVHFNGDFSGDIELHAPGFPTGVTKVPFEVLAEVVAEKVRRDRISELENASAEEILSASARSKA